MSGPVTYRNASWPPRGHEHFRSASVVTTTSYDHYLLAEWIHRICEHTLDIRVGIIRMVTACYRLVALRVLSRQVPVARHFNEVVPDIQAGD